MQYFNIIKVYKKHGKVESVMCGIDSLNSTMYTRIELDGERFFCLQTYGKNKVYRIDKERREMVFVKRIDGNEMRDARRNAQKTIYGE